MTENAVCPVCFQPQMQGLLDDACTTRLEQVLGEVPWLVEQLTITISKQAKIGAQASGSAPARERNPINYGALIVADELQNTLTTWARDVCDEGCVSTIDGQRTTDTCAYDLLGHIPQIRKHPAVGELVDEIHDAINRTRQIIDRPADRQFVGPCMAPTPDDEGREVTCLADIWAHPNAATATCKTCGITHDVAERRMWMLREADDRLFTVREAAQLIGSHGAIRVSESTIRGYIKREWIAYHGKINGSSVIRLGDLLDVLNDTSRRKAGQKLQAIAAA